MSSKNKTLQLAQIALCTAVIAVLSQISIPIGSVPVTLQSFAVAFAGYFLGWRNGSVSVFVFVLLGAFGVPVFANFKGGFAILAGTTGGYLYSFILMALFCGIGAKLGGKDPMGMALAILFGLLGLAVCYIVGSIQLAFVAHISLKAAFTAGVVPFLIKDIISLVLAYILSDRVAKRLMSRA